MGEKASEMMGRGWRRAALAAMLAAAIPALAAAGEHRIGFGYHYWKTVDDLDDLNDIEDEGYATVVSYQYLPGGLLRFEADVEYYPDGFGGTTESAYAPQIYVLVGRLVYAGVGVGVTQSDGFASGDEWSDPWYAARAGLDILLLPRLHLDINANYRVDAFEELEEVDTDALTIGAALRLRLL
jgi:hypothetical protein